MIRIIAKGTRADVRKLARKHGVKGFRTKDGVAEDIFGINEVLATCPYNSNNWNAVSKWFIDPDTSCQAPFSPGTCLYYWAE